MNNIQNGITGAVYFVTTTVVDWVDIFKHPLYKPITIDSLKYCQRNKGLIVYACCLIINHLHMIIASKEEECVSAIMRDFKKFTTSGKASTNSTFIFFQHTNER